jgi:hypothetical protein
MEFLITPWRTVSFRALDPGQIIDDRADMPTEAVVVYRVPVPAYLELVARREHALVEDIPRSLEQPSVGTDRAAVDLVAGLFIVSYPRLTFEASAAAGDASRYAASRSELSKSG